MLIQPKTMKTTTVIHIEMRSKSLYGLDGCTVRTWFYRTELAGMLLRERLATGGAGRGLLLAECCRTSRCRMDRGVCSHFAQSELAYRWQVKNRE